MTTIAYKDGVIAYDSRCTQGSTICDDNINKHREVDGVHYFLAGNVSDEDLFIRLHQGEKEDLPDNCRADAIIVKDGKLYTGSVSENGFWVSLERPDNWFAIGSGDHFALTAMDMGADAKTAVKMAMKRDCATGGKIRTFKVKQ